MKYDQQGHLLYAWGTLGTFAGGLWGVHGMSVDQEGNLYVAEVDSGRVQKFRPKQGANPDYPGEQADHAGVELIAALGGKRLERVGDSTQ